MTADVEDEVIVVQANEPLTEDGKLARQRVNVRYRDEIMEVDRAKVDYMDVSPKMVVSVATAMIPFLENDDANRALMGANMQRQAVPLLKTESPIVGTGMEYKAAVDSGVCVLAKEDGVVDRVSADEVIIKDDAGDLPQIPPSSNSCGPTRAPASTSVPSSTKARGSQKDRSSPTAPLPATARYPWVKTPSSAL